MPAPDTSITLKGGQFTAPQLAQHLRVAAALAGEGDFALHMTRTSALDLCHLIEAAHRIVVGSNRGDLVPVAEKTAALNLAQGALDAMGEQNAKITAIWARLGVIIASSLLLGATIGALL